MKRTERIAIGKVIFREREELITISPGGDGLVLQKLHYRHEVRVIESAPGMSSNKLRFILEEVLAFAEKQEKDAQRRLPRNHPTITS